MTTDTKAPINREYVKLLVDHFLSRSQAKAIQAALTGEERAHFIEIVREYSERVGTMPTTYQTEGQGDEAIAVLHYFSGAWDWYITEKDSDPDGEGQIQAFGLVRGCEEELGYISIAAIREVGAELDLYWTPKPLSQIRTGEGRA